MKNLLTSLSQQKEIHYYRLDRVCNVEDEMSWEKEIKELKNREEMAEQMGGKEKLKRQKDNNRLNIRERINFLCDKNSFHEI